MEIGDQPVDRLESVAGGDEDRSVAIERMDRRPSSSAALSSSRRLVVPTAISRPPALARR